jgi:hypothetical protein
MSFLAHGFGNRQSPGAPSPVFGGQPQIPGMQVPQQPFGTNMPTQAMPQAQPNTQMPNQSNGMDWQMLLQQLMRPRS